MDVPFLMSNFRLYPGQKMSFEHNGVRKNLFPSVCFCWESRIFLSEMERKFRFGGTIGYGNSYLELSFVISNYLDYMQYYMMLLEQCGHIVVKSYLLLLDWTRTKFKFAWSRAWTTLLPLRKTLSNFHFQLCQLSKPYVLHCTRHWAGRYKRY